VRSRWRALTVALTLIALAAGPVPAVSFAQRPVPVNLQLAPAAGSLSASWGVSSTAGLTGFRIRWKRTGGGGAARVDVARGVRSYTISKLRHVPYEVRVRTLYQGKPGPVALAEATPLPGLEEPPEEETPVEEPPEEEPPEEEPSEGEEEATSEKGPKEEEPQTARVSATPTGPPMPAGGWSVV